MEKSRTSTHRDTPCTLIIKRAEAEEQLSLCIERGHLLLKSTVKPVELTELKNAFSEWTDYNMTLLEQMYTCGEYLNAYNAWYGRISRVRIWSVSEEIEVIRQELEYKIDVLEDCLEELELIPESDAVIPQEIEDYDD
jgi:hypothetical protein